MMKSRHCAVVLPQLPRRNWPRLPSARYKSLIMSGLPFARPTRTITAGVRLSIMASDLLEAHILFNLLGREMRP